MRFGLRRVVLACVVIASALAVLVPAGSAGPRMVHFVFEAVPGPGQVTYGESIAYKAQISNTSGTTLTHVIFRMRKPFVGSPDNPDLEAAFQLADLLAWYNPLRGRSQAEPLELFQRVLGFDPGFLCPI